MTSPVISVSYKYDPVYHRFADYLGVDIHKRKSFETAKKLAMLFDWAKTQSNSDKFSEIAGVVDKARKKSGVSFIGEPLVTFLHQRVRLEMDNVKTKKVPEPTQREKYSVDTSAKELTKERDDIIESSAKSDRVAKMKNTRYINKYQKSIPKVKKGRIPSYDYTDTTTEELS